VRFGANSTAMGVAAMNVVLADTASSLQAFVTVFVSIYVILIFVWVLLGWIRVPYSRTTGAVQKFVDETVLPYIRVFRPLPLRLGPIDLTPIVAVVVLLVAAGLVNALIGAVL
jgi:YggT family protein